MALKAENVQILAEFFANTAHDFKTPIMVLMTTLYLLNEEPHTEKQEQIIRKLQRQVARLASLTENMFHMSALEIHDGYHFHPTDVVDLAEQIVQEFAPIAEAKHQTIDNVYTEESIVADIDPFFMRRAISNVISNAIMYSPEDGRILLYTYRHDAHVVFEVKDSGIGIGEKDLPHIFDRFYRADASRNTKTGGGGLGLSIVKKIVQDHSGYVEVDSELTRGSTFRIVVPVRQ